MISSQLFRVFFISRVMLSGKNHIHVTSKSEGKAYA